MCHQYIVKVNIDVVDKYRDNNRIIIKLLYVVPLLGLMIYSFYCIKVQEFFVGTVTLAALPFYSPRGVARTTI
jgi:hypothetical protein